MERGDVQNLRAEVLHIRESRAGCSRPGSSRSATTAPQSAVTCQVCDRAAGAGPRTGGVSGTVGQAGSVKFRPVVYRAQRENECMADRTGGSEETADDCQERAISPIGLSACGLDADSLNRYWSMMLFTPYGFGMPRMKISIPAWPELEMPIVPTCNKRWKTDWLI